MMELTKDISQASCDGQFGCLETIQRTYDGDGDCREGKRIANDAADVEPSAFVVTVHGAL
jgi:hypothetical protein